MGFQLVSAFWARTTVWGPAPELSPKSRHLVKGTKAKESIHAPRRRLRVPSRGPTKAGSRQTESAGRAGDSTGPEQMAQGLKARRFCRSMFLMC